MLALMRWKLVLLSITVLVLNIGRCPELFVSPRFFAEEGATYFASAYQQSFIANLFSAHFGYYTLYNQLATSLAVQVPLENAPLVTTMLSLLVQVGISFYVLWGDLPFIKTLPRRACLAVAIPLVSWPGHWLTIIGTQCWFAAGTFLVLLSTGCFPNRRRFLLTGCFLLLAGLTGVVSCFLLPAYGWRAIREKSQEFAGYALILFVCLLVHAGVLLHALLSSAADVACRFLPANLSTALGKTLVYQFAIPFSGRSFFEQQPFVAAGTVLKAALEACFGITLLIHNLFVLPLLAGIFVLLITLVAIWQNRTRLEVQIIGIALVVVSILSNICSINSAGGPRYYFLPSLMLLVLFIGLTNLKCRPVVILLGALVCTALVGNGYEYRSIMLKQAYNPGYPVWRTELARWRANPAYQLNIWPNSWTMSLTGQRTPLT